MNQFSRNFLLWSVIAVAMISIFSMFSENDESVSSSVPYSSFLAQVESGQVHDVSIQDKNITVRTKNGQTYRTYAPKDADMVPNLIKKEVIVNAVPPEERPLLISL
ncbi:MAG: ATP-dependent metallopeptidase FtsH/Yme1/Tma family protein, partial [Mailhella sp.]|nr:ATP-dependent metallopeptidase FtsH/Yme1/Tma family protein [Mailhella sp.]